MATALGTTCQAENTRRFVKLLSRARSKTSPNRQYGREAAAGAASTARPQWWLGNDVANPNRGRLSRLQSLSSPSLN